MTAGHVEADVLILLIYRVDCFRYRLLRFPSTLEIGHYQEDGRPGHRCGLPAR
jgi:hypothetical protein